MTEQNTLVTDSLLEDQLVEESVQPEISDVEPGSDDQVENTQPAQELSRSEEHTSEL